MLVRLNDFVLNDNISNFYIDEDIVGLSIPTIRTSSGDYSGMDGGYIGAQFYGMRQITLVGRCFGRDVTELEDQRLEIQTALGNKAVTMQVVTNAGRTYQVNCNLIQFDMPIQRAIVQAPFKIELLAPDPVIYDTTTGSALTATLSRVSGGGYTFPYEYPVVWAAGSTPTNVNNSGTVAAYPVITIAGTATNPVITNNTTGKFFKLNGLTMSSTDILVIDTKNRTVLLNGGSVFYKVSSDSSWLTLEPGDNLMSYTTDSSGDTAQAVLTWLAGYWGI